MTELSKLFSTVLLLAAGFFGASMFGPPELTERLIGRWATPPVNQGEGLRPLSPEQRGPGQATAPVRVEPAHATSARAATGFTPVPLPTLPIEPTSAQPSAWQTPEFATNPVADPHPMAGPSADFNAWLGAAGNWLDRENETAQTSPAPSFQRDTAYQRDTAVAPVAGFDEPTSPRATVAWLPPRDVANDVSAPPASGPSLFANQPIASGQQTAVDPWGAWDNNVQATPAARFPAQLGPSPLENSSRTYEAGYAPVARPRVQTTYGTHVVTDGDTLLDLAKRYLGDASRAEELYQLNRDRLDHPDLLPIGIVLRMPDEPRQKGVPPVSDWSQQQRSSAMPMRNGPFSTVSSGAELREEPSRLVPVGDPAERPARLPDAMFADEWSW